MPRLRIALSSLVSTALALAPFPALATGDVADFDGNVGAPDLRGAAELSEISGSTAEQASRGGADWSVSPSGAFQWSKSLEVVPGINGVQPSLGVEYDTQAGNGLLGQGFTLTGLPALVRVPGTDNGATSGAEPRGVQFDAHDTFAIAPGGWGTPVSPRGKLVQAFAGSSSYHTAVESWEEFTPYGHCGVASFSPCTWVARDGHGNTYYYGASDDGRLWERDAGHDNEGIPVAQRGIVAWGLTHYRDQHGNLYRVEYDEPGDGFMLYPKRIEYGCQQVVDPGTPSTPPGDDDDDDDDVVGFDPAIDPDAPLTTMHQVFGDSGSFTGIATTVPVGGITITLGDDDDDDLQGSCPGTRHVLFEYETRPDITALPGRYDRRLAQVSMYAEGHSVRGYRFEYEPQASPGWGRSRMHRAVELGSDLMSEAGATTFDWSDGNKPDWESQELRAWPVDTDERVATLAGDLNGDGKEDVVRVSFGSDRRRVTWALGQAEAMEWGQAPLGPIEGPVQRSGASREWNATIADVDVDGRDDLVLWILHDGQGEIEVMHGSPTGLGPAVPYFKNAAVEAFAQHGARESRFYRLLVADVNGDQVDDLVLINKHPDDTDRLAFILGGSGGLEGVEERGGAQLEVVDNPGLLEPVVTDIDGDGTQDVVVTYSRITGVTSQIFRGSPGGLKNAAVLAWNNVVDDALCPGSCFGPSECPCVGNTPFQILTPDANGDGIGDLTLAYSGRVVPMGNTNPKPFGRNVQTWLGQGDFGSLPQDAANRRLDAGKHALLETVGYPGIDYSVPNRAFWEHHAGDVNGDGISDLVAFYAGVDGLRAGFAVGTPTGGLGPMMTITSCASSADDANWGAPCPAMPDGDHDVHRTRSTVLDFDGDDRADLLSYYAGASGRDVFIARGSGAGLGEFEHLLKEGPVTERTLPELDHAASVSLLAPDLNGDGRRDLVLASQDEVVLLPTIPGTPDDVGRPDLVVAVHNAFGGSVRVEHEMASRLPGAIDPDASTCGQATGDDCGTPNDRARPLATRVRELDGRGDERGTRYRYVNGRYYPGPVILSSAGTRPHTRADLAFEIVENEDEQTGTITRFHYHQDPDLKRLAYRVDEEALVHPVSGPPFLMPSARETRTYTKGVSPFGTHKIELTASQSLTWDLGSVSTDVTHSYEYGNFGGRTSAIECADYVCIETVQTYFPIDWSDYIIQRVRDRKVHVVGDDKVLSWERHDYAGGNLLRRVQQLLCDDAEQCDCFSDPDADSCVASSQGRWVDVEHNRQYDLWGNLTSSRDALGHQRHTEFDATYNTYPTAVHSTVLDAAGNPQTIRTESTYYDSGRVETVTDPSGAVTSYYYDVLGRPERVEHANGREQHWEYHHQGDASQQHVLYRELVDVDRGLERWEERYFDGQGRRYKTRMSAAGEVVTQHWEEYFDNFRRIGLRSDRYFESDPGSVIWNEMVHDARGRLVEHNRVRDALLGGGGTPLGTLTRRIYFGGGYTEYQNAAEVDDDGLLLGEDMRYVSYSIDSRGNVGFINEQGKVTHIIHDDAFRPRLIWGRTLGTSQGPPPAETYVSYSYDSFGRVQIANDSEGYVLVDYTDVGKIEMTDDANGEVVDYTYDGIGRLLTRTSSAGTETFDYDNATSGVGRLSSVVGPWGTLAISAYDGAGNVATRSTTLTGLPGVHTESYARDARGLITRKTLPDGTELEYEYDDAGQLRVVTVDGAQYLEVDSYDAQGHPAFAMTPAATLSYDYTADHRLLNLLAEPNGGGDAFIDNAYSYDGVGNVRGIVDQRADTSAAGVDTDNTWTFDYDHLDQLVSAIDYKGTVVHYGYDYESNPTRKGDLFFQHAPGTIDAFEGSLSGPMAIHAELDNMGRVAQKVDARGTWDYVHDGLGRLRQVWLDGDLVDEHQYDHAGGRVRKVEHVGGDTITTWYLSANYEVRAHSSDPTNVVATRIVDGLGGAVVATLTDDPIDGAPDPSEVFGAWGDAISDGHVGGAPEGIWFHHQDHLGSTSVVTDANGAPVAEYRNSPWGDRLERSAGFDVAFREFTGQIRDEQSGLLYYGARYYDPALARFMQPDADDFGMPFYAGGLLDPGSYNRHVYVRNNPVRYIDPTGHTPEETKTHTVVAGDTMQGLAATYLGDSTRWPELWAANPQIHNPHWIDVGDTITVPGAGTEDAGGGNVTPTETATTTVTATATATVTGTATTTETATVSEPVITTVTATDTVALEQELAVHEATIERYKNRPKLHQAGPLGLLAPGPIAERGLQASADAMEWIAGDSNDYPPTLLGMGEALVRVPVGGIVAGIGMAGSIYFDKASSLVLKPYKAIKYEVTGGPSGAQYRASQARAAEIRSQLGR